MDEPRDETQGRSPVFDDELAERALSAWLRMSTLISNERQSSVMRFNEALVCNLLICNEMEAPGTRLTATDLCERSHILKSQMNRILTSMEEAGIIHRERSADDRRCILVSLRHDSDVFTRQHERSLSMVRAVIDRLGPERCQEVIDVFDAVSDAAEEVL